MVQRREQLGNARLGFTLLEVMLAMAIGILLLGGLYVAMNVQLRYAQAGRDVVEQSKLVRGILARMSNDIVQSLGPASSTAAASGSSGAGTAAGASGAGTSGSGQSGATTGNTTTSGAGAGSASSPSNGASSNSSSTGGPVLVNLGVQGDATHLTLSASRVPREFTLGPGSDSATTSQVGISDLRRVSYWLVGGGGSAQGLAWMEYTPVTSPDALNTLPPNVPDEASHIIAEEVKSLTFSYFDGANWQDTWDGTTPGADGVTPMGPPMAIAIVLGVQMAGAKETKSYRHVVAVPGANNLQNSSANSSSATNSGSTTNTGQ
jgi:prepilin-type N-terminal cleavage/methylation domain-containing protein